MIPTFQSLFFEELGRMSFSFGGAGTGGGTGGGFSFGSTGKEDELEKAE